VKGAGGEATGETNLRSEGQDVLSSTFINVRIRREGTTTGFHRFTIDRASAPPIPSKINLNEIKTGPGADLSPPQKTGFSILESGKFEFVRFTGKGAKEAGLSGKDFTPAEFMRLFRLRIMRIEDP
jgi:hypothetical protein